jgi:P27 family predicted phage terminase small subunit
MPGPAPKPTDLKRFEGFPGHHPIPLNEVHYPNGLPTKPRMSAGASKYWNELVDEMSVSGVLKRVDRYSLRQLCEDEAALERAYAGFWKMADAVKRKATAGQKKLPGGELLALLGTTQGRNAMRCLRDLAQRLILLRREFGLTPSSRARIIVASSERPQDEIDDAIFNRPVELLVVPPKLN